MGPRKKLSSYIKQQRAEQEVAQQRQAEAAKAKAQREQLEVVEEKTEEEWNDGEVTRSRYFGVTIVRGLAGTGQTHVEYPRLLFHPQHMFALGSPIGIFLSVRCVCLYVVSGRKLVAVCFVWWLVFYMCDWCVLYCLMLLLCICSSIPTVVCCITYTQLYTNCCFAYKAIYQLLLLCTCSFIPTVVVHIKLYTNFVAHMQIYNNCCCCYIELYTNCCFVHIQLYTNCCYCVYKALYQLLLLNRGVEDLGPEFVLPTCPHVFNIFHPVRVSNILIFIVTSLLVKCLHL